MGENLGLVFVVISTLIIIGALVYFFHTGMSIDSEIFSSARVK